MSEVTLDQVNSASKTQAAWHLDAFLAQLRRRNCASGTLLRYGQILSEFVLWVGGRDWNEISAQDIEVGFLVRWEAKFAATHGGHAPKPNTVRLRITALKSFYDWLERMDHVVRNPMRKIHPPPAVKRINDWLRPSEDRAMLEAPKTPQERIITYWLRFTGCRYCEGEFALNRDIDLAPTTDYPYGRITITSSKTVSGVRVIPILPELRPEIERWRGYQTILGLDGPELPFLTTRNQTPMSHTFVWRIVKRVAHAADVRRQAAPDATGHNVSKVSPHTLRRTLGSSLINAGVPLNVVSKILGHANTAVTEAAYAELTAENIAAQVLEHLN